MNGFLLIDKHEGISSAAVVSRVKRLLKISKAGHCGTLDPLATGLLIVCTDKATRLASFLTDTFKQYEAQIMLGATSTSFDRDGEIVESEVVSIPSLDEVSSAARRFQGSIEQTAPIYSALKVAGKPLYAYARKNIPVETKTRTVEVESLRIVQYAFPSLHISVKCSAGTYIRSLAQDIGQALNCGGYIHELRRTKSGSLDVANAISLADLELIAREHDSDRDRLLQDPRFLRCFGTVERVLNLPVIYVSTGRESIIDRGIPIRAADLRDVDRKIRRHDLVALRNSDERLLAVGRALFSGESLWEHTQETVIEYVRVM